MKRCSTATIRVDSKAIVRTVIIADSNTIRYSSLTILVERYKSRARNQNEARNLTRVREC